MSITDGIMMVIFVVIVFAIGILIGLPTTPNGDITNKCIELGYDTALHNDGKYYCANVLIIEDSYRIDEQTD